MLLLVEIKICLIIIVIIYNDIAIKKNHIYVAKTEAKETL